MSVTLSLSRRATSASARGISPSRSQARRLRLLAAAGYVLNGTTQKLATLGGKIAGLRLNLDFVPRPDDLFIVTYPRSGTTWMQMILYQLATDGSLEFEHIYQVCPYFENSLGMRSGFANVPEPRTFKSHLTYRQVPKGCKYIYVARNGKDVAASYFHFSRSHLGFRGTFDEFFDQFVRGRWKPDRGSSTSKGGGRTAMIPTCSFCATKTCSTTWTTAFAESPRFANWNWNRRAFPLSGSAAVLHS